MIATVRPPAAKAFSSRDRSTHNRYRRLSTPAAVQTASQHGVSRTSSPAVGFRRPNSNGSRKCSKAGTKVIPPATTQPAGKTQR